MDININTSQGPCSLRIPSHQKGALIIKEVGIAELMSAFAHITGSPSAEDLTRVVNLLGGQAFPAAGAVIGVSMQSYGPNKWEYGKTCGDVPFRRSPLDYGYEVYERLHELGFSLSDIIVLAFNVGKQWLDSAQLTSEAQSLVDFTKAKKEA